MSAYRQEPRSLLTGLATEPMRHVLPAAPGTTPASTPREAVRGQLIAGRFELRFRLGTGGMSEVWLARDRSLERLVAVKLHAAHADLERFRQEALSAASLSHPNIAAVFDYGEFEGQPYLVLEYLPGGTLEDRLAARGRLADEETAYVAQDIAAGLAHAHGKGVVHRDVKPSNVVFDAEGRAKITDFGIARTDGLTPAADAEAVLGTAAYISPELVLGERAEATSDVYSFGVTLYRMLTGDLPFDGGSAFELARKHVAEVPPCVRSRRPNAPVGLSKLADSALVKDPGSRLADGSEVLRALKRPARSLPPAAVRAKHAFARRSARWHRRVAALIALGAVGVAGLALSLIAFDSGGSGTRPQNPVTAGGPGALSAERRDAKSPQPEAQSTGAMAAGPGSSGRLPVAPGKAAEPEPPEASVGPEPSGGATEAASPETTRSTSEPTTSEPEPTTSEPGPTTTEPGPPTTAPTTTENEPTTTDPATTTSASTAAEPAPPGRGPP